MTAYTSANPFDDPTVPHPARRYNYWLGGRENYKVDRAAGDAVAAAMPTIRVGIRENRAFLRRAVRFMVDEGIRQLIDIGPGIPAPDCSHEVAQAVAPETNVLYADNDPVVIAYSRAMLSREPEWRPRTPSLPSQGIDQGADDAEESRPKGQIGHVLADLCEPEVILSHNETRKVIDFTRPVGLLIVAVAHFCVEDGAVYPAVRALVDAIPPGSIIAFSHAATDYLDPKTKANVDNANEDHRSPFRFRDTFEVAAFAFGLEMVEPGLVPVSEWRAADEPRPRPSAEDVGVCAWVARKPR